MGFWGDLVRNSAKRQFKALRRASRKVSREKRLKTVKTLCASSWRTSRKFKRRLNKATSIVFKSLLASIIGRVIINRRLTGGVKVPPSTMPVVFT